MAAWRCVRATLRARLDGWTEARARTTLRARLDEAWRRARATLDAVGRVGDCIRARSNTLWARLDGRMDAPLSALRRRGWGLYNDAFRRRCGRGRTAGWMRARAALRALGCIKARSGDVRALDGWTEARSDDAAGAAGGLEGDFVERSGWTGIASGAGGRNARGKAREERIPLALARFQFTSSGAPDGWDGELPLALARLGGGLGIAAGYFRNSSTTGTRQSGLTGGR